MPPSVPQLDEHGFPIPPTFDNPSPQRRASYRLGYVWQVGLVLTFMVLLAGWVLKAGLGEHLNGVIADQLVERAQQKAQLGDFPGAVADLDRATRWTPNRPQILELRAFCKLKTHDVDGSLADYDEIIRLNPKRVKTYISRSIAYQRLNRHREAIEDLNKVIAMMPHEAMLLNNRAYARAVGGMELDEALVDVQEAIDIVDHKVEAEQVGDQIRQSDRDLAQLQIAEINNQKAAYLDTRGYIRFLQGNHEAALEDLNKAIEHSTNWQNIGISEFPRSLRSVARKQMDQELSVMYHHRGQVLEKLGRRDEAQSDLDRGNELGYNPAEGVF